ATGTTLGARSCIARPKGCRNPSGSRSCDPEARWIECERWQQFKGKGGAEQAAGDGGIFFSWCGGDGDIRSNFDIAAGERTAGGSSSPGGGGGGLNGWVLCPWSTSRSPPGPAQQRRGLLYSSPTQLCNTRRHADVTGN
ncbi:unnamed protein product, partial [Laminaria digitata]